MIDRYTQIMNKLNKLRLKYNISDDLYIVILKHVNSNKKDIYNYKNSDVSK
jgi:hypothetical protein